MKNTLSWMLLTLILLGFGQLSMAGATEDRFREGSQYQRIDPPAPLTDQTDKVEVVEMFFYACPHCYQLEPRMTRWLAEKPYVNFQRMPAIIGPSWADQARAFYMIRALGDFDRMHAALFKAIHEDGKQIYNEYSVVEFFASQGVDRKKALDLYLSPEIAASVNQARIKTVKYGLRGVPAVIVNGKYKTAPFFVHNQDEMIEVVDSLVEKERHKMSTANVQEK
ncbi:thiol:disulfide interchange protein DsbA [Thiogranum longum]|uniref:Thiol:disulfide interchange protein n=1 Tax=Thiogranum longum TaxID=1537524 RepID=A0A4R1HA70_9GAMM|nr:thiol:disulfide interchange protein DsbA/DsbL [Thiogranum longum]TCK18218.1 thiol:disulfide interchange protein DsbA [Thiogranum longum]